MIIYFADRSMNVLGHASDKLDNSYRIANDVVTTEIEHGTQTLEFDLYFDSISRMTIQEYSTPGNYILRDTGETDNYRLYTIIDREINVNDRTINIYAEDGGLDLLNETAGPFDPGNKQSIDFYIKKYIADTGFAIGKNEIGTTTKKYLLFDNDETVTARLLSIALNFDAELSYSYTIKGLKVTAKKVDIYKRIGSDKAIELRTDREIDNIVVKESIAELCSGIYPVGSSPDGTAGYISGTRDGKTLYTWVRFSDSSNGSEGFENSVSNHSFIGLAWNQTDYLESEDPSKYHWYRMDYSKVVIVPNNVSSGIKERKGGDGADAWDEDDRYTWIRFADDEFGTNISSSSKSWIGIATGKDSASPSSNPDDYTWDKYAGWDTTTLYLRPNSYGISDGRKCYWKFAPNIDGSGGLYNTASRSHHYVGFITEPAGIVPANPEEYIWVGDIIDSSYDGTYVEFDWVASGVQEYDGKTAKSTYTWLRFSKDETGSEISYTPKSARYIGLYYGAERPASTNSVAYKWYDVSGDNDKITLVGYSYDKGDIYVKDGTIYSRKAIEKWSRYKIAEEGSRTGADKGAIVRMISYNEGNPDELFNLALKDLQKYSEPVVDYEVTIKYLPENVFVGDRINIVDDAGELYVSARLLKLEQSMCNGTIKATFGDYVKKTSGINSDLQKLANQFSAYARSQRTYYTWTVYADDEEGTGITLNPENKAFMGLAMNRIAMSPDLSDPSVYTWTKIRGEDAIRVAVSSQSGIIFKGTAISTTLTATVQRGATALTSQEVSDLGFVIKWYKVVNGTETHMSGYDGLYSITVTESGEKANYRVKLETGV